VVLEADVAEDADTVRLLETIRKDHAGLEILVSNVAFAQVTGALEDYQRRSLQKSIGYSAWPFVDTCSSIRRSSAGTRGTPSACRATG